MNNAELARAITDPKTGEYRTTANRDRGEIAIIPILYNRIRRVAHRAGQSLDHSEIEYCINDILARHCAESWSRTNAGKGRAAFSIVKSQKTVPARAPMQHPTTPEEWLHGLMLAVTKRYVSMRGWLRSDVEIAKREEWRDMFRPTGRSQSLKALPLRINHYIELDGLPPKFVDAIADGLIDKIDLKIIGCAKSSVQAAKPNNHNYQPIKLGAVSVAQITGEGETETQKRLDRLERVFYGQNVEPVEKPIERITSSVRYAAPQIMPAEVIPAAIPAEIPARWIDSAIEPIREDWQRHDYKPSDNKLIRRAKEETPSVRVAEYLARKIDA